MSARDYLARIFEILRAIDETQRPQIERAGAALAQSIRSGGRAYLFGSGHSVLPVLDIFPRYGSFVGFYPILDPRLMWFNVVGPGGARELLWLERREGYAQVILSSYALEACDTLLIFSHGGLNAVPIEMAMEAKKKGLTVIAVSSRQNHLAARATHSTGKKLFDLADVAIDNCVPPEDALVSVEGIQEKFAAGSTVAAVTIAMALVAEVARCLVTSGHRPVTFVAPGAGLPADHNENVFREYAQRLRERL